MVNTRMAAVLALVLTLHACQYDPDSYLYVTTEPSDADVVGTYVLESQRVDLKAGVTGHPVIVLHPDHRYEATDFPEWRESGIGEYALAGTYSTAGTWRIGSLGGLDDGSGKTKTIYGVIFEGSSPEMPGGKCTRAATQKGLIFGYGDPDGGKSMSYVMRE